MRYSKQARSAIRFANQEAARLGHNLISTGHLLLGLIRQGEGTAMEILKDANVDIEKMRIELENTMEDKGRGIVFSKMQFGERASNALKLAEEESQNMGHKYIGTEHILLGLIREQEGVAGKALAKFGVKLNRAKAVAHAVSADEDEYPQTLTFRSDRLTISNSITDHMAVVYEKEVLDLEEASELLRITVNDLNKLLRTEDVPARMIGGQWRFSRSALVRWLGEGKSRDYIS